MFDCGLHMSYNDDRRCGFRLCSMQNVSRMIFLSCRFPDFSLLSRSGNFNVVVDAVFITHFHLDHCGALPYFTEVLGYSGPIFMTYPTKAIMPLMLEDYQKVLGSSSSLPYDRQQIRDCMRKVTAIELLQTIKVDRDIEMRAFYAGHVLGAAMIYVRVGNENVVYTGDYNMTPDRHLGAASIERLRPDVLITESTYATTLRDSKKTREKDFLTAVHETVLAGGKVLVPVFAVGRAQELLLLIHDFWERMNLQVPVYFSAGLAARASLYYNLLLSWTSQSARSAAMSGRDVFGITRLKHWDRANMHAPGPCVLFATPGMLSGGTSLEVFRAWAGSERNLVVLPGYCMSNTVGGRLLSGATRDVRVDKNTTLDVKCKVRYLSFSAHADVKGILQLVGQCEPRAVVLVHGEKAKMQFLRAKITSSFGLPCYCPPNGGIVTVNSERCLTVGLSKQLLWSCQEAQHAARLAEWRQLEDPTAAPPPMPANRLVVSGVLLARQGAEGMPATLELCTAQEAADAAGLPRLELSYSCEVRLAAPTSSGHSFAQAPATTGPGRGEHGLQSAQAPQEQEQAGSQVDMGVVIEAEPMQHDSGQETDAGPTAEHHGAPQEQAQLMQHVGRVLQQACPSHVVQVAEQHVTVASFHARLGQRVCQSQQGGDESTEAGWQLNCSWLHDDAMLGERCIRALTTLAPA